MINEGRAYDVLVVSASEKMNEALKPLLSGGRYRKVSFALSVATANRLMLENTYDFIIINSPLPDDFGTKLAKARCDFKIAMRRKRREFEKYNEAVKSVETAKKIPALLCVAAHRSNIV